MRNIIIFLTISLFFCSDAFASGSTRSFDGANDEVDFGNNHDVTTNNVSMCGWTRTTEDASNDFIVGKKQDAVASAGYMLRTSSTDPLQAVTGDGVDSAQCTSGTDPDGRWIWACAVWDASTSTLVIYEDGSENTACTATNTNIGSLTNSFNLQTGEASDDTDDHNGLNAHISVWTSVLIDSALRADFMFKPDMAEMSSFYSPLWFDNPEIDLSQGSLTGTVSGTNTQSPLSPPVMYGNGMPL